VAPIPGTHRRSVRPVREHAFVMKDDDLIQPFAGRSCADCAESDPALLEFDHPRDFLEFPANQLTLNEWTSLPTSPDDYEVVCGHCHRRRAASRGLLQHLMP
jgi:hypothetical protein